MDAGADPWWIIPFLVFCYACPIVGIGAALYTNNGYWMILAIPGVIIMGGY